MTTIKVQIERIILKGIDLDSAKLRLVQAAFEDEISRILAANANMLDVKDNIALPRLWGETLKLNSNNTTDLGIQIAHSLYRTISLQACKKKPESIATSTQSSE